MLLIVKPVSTENEEVLERVEEVINGVLEEMQQQAEPAVEQNQHQNMHEYLENAVPQEIVNAYPNMTAEQVAESINTGFESLIERYKQRTWEPSYDIRYEQFIHSVDANMRNKVRKIWTYLIEKEVKLCKILVIELPSILHPLLLKMLEGFVNNLIKNRTEQDHLDIITQYIVKDNINRAGLYLQQIVDYSVKNPRTYSINFRDTLLKNILRGELLEYFVVMLAEFKVLFSDILDNTGEPKN